jgi:hypothetical protein
VVALRLFVGGIGVPAVLEGCGRWAWLDSPPYKIVAVSVKRNGVYNA